MKLLKQYIFLFLLSIIFIPLFLYKLDSIPTNLTGDETTYLGITYRVLFSPATVNPLMILEDAKPALNFYWMGTWIQIFGFGNTVFAMRFSIAIFAILTLFIFYFFMKGKTSPLIAFITTVMLGTNIWYLNFARSGWFNIIPVCLGLAMIYVLEKGIHLKKGGLILLSGVLGGLCFYSYLSGYIFPISGIVYLVALTIFKKKHRIFYLKNLVLFSIIIAFLALPIFISVRTMENNFFLRPSVVFILNNPQAREDGIITTVTSQVHNVTKGLILMTPDVIGKGSENPRYHPIQTSIVDPFIRILFLLSLVFAFKIRPKIALLAIVYFLTLLTVGALTIDAPNLARTVSALSFIYGLSGITLFYLITILQKHRSQAFIWVTLLCITLFIALNNVNNYFLWATSPELTQARQPAIEYNEFDAWQEFQINRAKQAQLHITNYEWYEIRKTLLH